MNWFSRFFQREDIEGTQTGKSGANGGNYMQNVVSVYSAEQAMKIAAVYRATKLISEGVAVLTLQYMRYDKAQKYYKLDEGTLSDFNYMLSVRPNRRMNAYDMYRNMIQQIILKGNAYIVPIRDYTQRVTELVLVNPDCVAVDVYNNKYTVADPINGINRTFDGGEILHFKNPGRDGGYMGISTIHYAAMALGIAATADSETLKRFATGGRMKAFLQNQSVTKGIGAGEYTDSELHGMAGDINDAVSSGQDVIAIPGDGKLTTYSMSSTDMQFLDSRKFTVREIARFFGVPASKLMDDSNSNYKSVEMSNINFYSETIQPLTKMIEAEFNAKLVAPGAYRNNKFQYDISAIYALDLDSKAKWDKARLDNGQASVNDIRRENNRPPVDMGDDIYLSVNLAPIGSPKLSGELAGNNNTSKEGE